ncbi:MAG: ABC transporter permease [Sphaerochaetaceae bacterium]|jgi:ribose transport system permease protein
MSSYFGSRSESRTEILSALGRFGALVVLIIVGSIVSEVFLSSRNISNIITNASVMIIMGVGQTIAIITNGPDLSAGSIMTICAVVAAILVKTVGIFFPVAILIALALGIFLGFINGYMIAKVGIPSFISTYGLQWAVFGFAYVILRGYVIYDFPASFRFIGNGYLFSVIPMPIVIMVIVVITGIFLLNKTTVGRCLFAVGSNSVSANMSGVDTSKTVFQAFIISGALSALAGVVLIARINAVQADIGRNYLLPVIATVFMGGTSPTGGQGTIIGTVIGAIIITIVQNIMNLLAVPSVWRDAIIGLLIIVTVLVDIIVKKRISNIKIATV